MWPTFYIPSVLRSNDDFVPGQPYKLCGTAFGATVTVPTPPEAITGGVQLVIVDYQVSVGSGLIFPDSSGPPWRRIFDAGRVPRATFINFGSSKQIMFWRYYTAGDPDLEIVTSPSGSVFIAYTSIVLNNPNYDDPWFTLHAHIYQSNSGSANKYEGASTLMEVANSGDLLVWCSASYDNDALDPTKEPSGADVEFACTPYINAPGVGWAGHTMAALQTRAKTVNNLLKYCPTLDLAAWNVVGLTRSTGVLINTECRGAVLLTNNVGSGQHYAEQTVALEAGKTYGFFVQAMQYFTMNPGAVVWMSYIKPDSSEHGCGMGPSGEQYDMTGSTEVSWATAAGKPSYSTLAGDNNTGYFGTQRGFLVTPDVSGDYKIRIYVLPGPFGASPAVQPGVNSAAGGTNCWASISGVVLQEGPSEEQMPAFLPTTDQPILIGTRRGILTPIAGTVASITASAIGHMSAVMRRSGGLRPPCVLFSPTLRYGSMDFDDFTVNDTYERHDSELRGYQAIGASHVVYDTLANKKFYCELKVDSFGSGGTDDAYTIGACIAEAMQDHQVPQSGTVSKVGDSAGQYSYMSTGKTWTDGTQDAGTVAAWSVGDFIGVGINLQDWEITFYRNGTLVKTQSIPNDICRYALWRAQFGIRGPGTGANQWRATYNFKGPFGGRKPSGFVAYDFDNEVT